MASLIVFYSRSGENYFGGELRYIEVGNTEKVAKMIADITNDAVIKLEQKIPYSDDYNVCIEQAKADLKNNVRPELVNLPDNLDQYDDIYLGYPNYWGTMPMAVYSFLEAYDMSGKTIHPFCTHEGAGMSTTESDIKRVANGVKVTKGLPICGSEVDMAVDKVENWIMFDCKA